MLIVAQKSIECVTLNSYTTYSHIMEMVAIPGDLAAGVKWEFNPKSIVGWMKLIA